MTVGTATLPVVFQATSPETTVERRAISPEMTIGRWKLNRLPVAYKRGGVGGGVRHPHIVSFTSLAIQKSCYTFLALISSAFVPSTSPFSSST
jgi:hypothetical protein